MPNLYFFLRGTHVHHLNYGIFLLAGVSAYLLFDMPSGRNLRFAALGYGIAMALTFDEFGMWCIWEAVIGNGRVWMQSSSWLHSSASLDLRQHYAPLNRAM